MNRMHTISEATSELTNNRKDLVLMSVLRRSLILIVMPDVLAVSVSAQEPQHLVGVLEAESIDTSAETSLRVHAATRTYR